MPRITRINTDEEKKEGARGRIIENVKCKIEN